MNARALRLTPVGVLIAVSVAASGCAEPGGYYVRQPAYYERPATVYYAAPSHREQEHWRHEREEHAHHERHHEHDDD